MQSHRFGPTGRDVAVVGQGTWYIERGQRAAVMAALRRGLDLGMTHIDTAELYGSGAAEQIVGEAIAGRRDEVFLVSKVLPENASAKERCRLREVAQAAEDRPARLLSPPLARPPSARGNDRGFEELRGGQDPLLGRQQLRRRRPRRGLAIAGDGAIACNQVLYHLGERGIEHASSLVRGARRRRRRIQPLRPRQLSWAARRRRRGARRDRRRARRHAAAGRPRLPGTTAPGALRNSQGGGCGTCRENAARRRPLG